MARAAGLVLSLLIVVLGAAAPVGPQVGAAASVGGWTVSMVPGTGADDILLGSTCANALRCFAVGVSITNISGPISSFAPIVEVWDGETWNLEPPPPLPGGDGGGLFAVSCLSSSDCWAVGTVIDEANGNGNPAGTLIEHWDGGAWSIVPSPDPTTPGISGAILQSVDCTSPSSCMAVGYSTTDNGGSGLNVGQLIEQWNGSDWSIVPGGSSGQAYDMLTKVDCLTSSDCWAVGNAGPVSQNPNFLPIFPNALGDQGLVEHWDGAGWSVVPSVSEPAPDGGYLYGLACTGPSECWASGSTTDETGTASGILMERWDGTSWSDESVSVPNPAPGVGAIVSSISCTGPTQCWAAGSTGPFGGGNGSNFKPEAFIENWNGSSWSIDPSPSVTALSLLNNMSCLSGVGCTAVGTSAVGVGNSNDPGLRAFVEQMSFPPATSQGIVLAGRDGGIFNYGTAPFLGSLGGQHLNAPIVGVAVTPDGRGYWMAGADGGVFAYGNARFYGSMGGRRLAAPVVGMATTPDGRGYWLVASDGGVFAFGDARFDGSMGNRPLHAPMVGMTASGVGGYWLVASDGGVFSFGGAAFEGSMGAQLLARPVTGMGGTPDGEGYWLVAADGGVFAYGDAAYAGSVPGQGITGQPAVVGMCPTPTDGGYWLVGSNGAVYTYGDAAFLGAPAGHALAAPMAGIACF